MSKVKCLICGESYVKRKCVVCGNIFLAEDKRQIRCWNCRKCLICGKRYDELSEHLKTHGLTRQEYLSWFYAELPSGVLEPKRYGYVTKNCLDCGKPFRVKKCNVYEQIRCQKCRVVYLRRWRRTPYRRLYQRLYQKKRRHTLVLHGYDKTTDLTIQNGRVKGFLWLERHMKKHGYTKRAWEHETRFGLTGIFIVVDENHTPYCNECGGKILIAVENERYSITEYACSVCGLVLQA